MANLHECNACGHIFDHDMYEVCPECQRHPDDDIDNDLLELEEEEKEDDIDDKDESEKYGRTFGMGY